MESDKVGIDSLREQIYRHEGGKEGGMDWQTEIATDTVFTLCIK